MKTNQPSSARGMEYWRSLEHLADGPEIRELMSKEFPGYDVDELVSGSRRKFLKLMGASMALAGVTLTGCRRWPEEKLHPYSTNPRDRMPGVPVQYATAYEIGGVAQPLLVTSYDGRPIKIDGNPSHPFSWTIQDKLGSADVFSQATILDMYDPQRSRSVVSYAPARAESSWEKFAAFAKSHFAGLKSNGKSLAILSEASSGPSMADMRKRLLEAYPGARWYEYEPITRDNETEGAKLAFGKPVRTVLNLDKAQTVVLLDADPLGMHPAHVKYAADWATGRRTADDGKMSRVYIAEGGFSLTGSNADVRLPVNPARLYAIARAIAGKLGVADIPADEKLSDLETKFVNAAVTDLQASGKDGLVASGGVMPPAGQALVHAINEKLGAVGNTVTLLEDPTAGDVSHGQAISQLATEMAAGQFTTLLILGGNPVYDAPADVSFEAAMAKAPVSIHLAQYENETSQQCKWHLPQAHFLESWGDARAWDGTAGIVQPLIMPLYEGKSAIEVLAMLSRDPITDGHEIVKRTWAGLLDKDGFDLAIRKVIESGLLPGSAFKTADVQVKSQEFPPSAAAAGGYYLRFQPDWHTYDGRFANNGWLQETPDPLTKLVWDNAALVSKKNADALGLTTGTLLRIETAEKYGKHSIEIAAYVMPGQPDGVITLPLGYGRSAAGHIGDDVGINTYAVRTSEGPLLNSGARLSLAPGSYVLVSTQDHYLFDTIGMEGTEKRIGHKNESGMIVREATLTEFKENPRCVHGNGTKRTIGLQLFQEPVKLDNVPDTHAWGMSIDMNSCIGCNACTIACQSENNIPVVGKAQANMHRSMNWIRIDRYFKADDRHAEDPGIEVVYQPMTCQQCENAPCEQVCPVGATVHDTEGINTMVYNRCIGTRYCSNNCPYKVRRFNYLDYQAQDPRQNWAKPYLNIPDQQQLDEVNKIKWMLFNPEVSVRMRGVMEKCTYCVQRIHRTTIAKRAEGTPLMDGDIVTACQQACPTQAIVFGDLNDRNSKVSKLQRNPRAYGVLQEELDTRPRTQYLAKIRNPSSEEVKKEA
jgi:molybdopterin-containing oxidoreductase family iron-sulfur binding subunit